MSVSHINGSFWDHILPYSGTKESVNIYAAMELIYNLFVFSFTSLQHLLPHKLQLDDKKCKLILEKLQLSEVSITFVYR